MNIVKHEKGDMVTDSRSISASWRNYFSQLLNVHGDNDVRLTEIHTAEPIVLKEKHRSFSKEIGLQVHAEKSKYMIMFRHKNAGHNISIHIGNKSFETVEAFKCL
jgi:hypothetical protein